jgi:hypothetical protein
VSTGPVGPGGFVLLSALALAAAGIAAAFVLAGGAPEAGAAAAVAGLALAAARWRAPPSPRLVLVGAVSERVLEAAVLGAIAWMALPEEPRLAGAAIVALGGSYLAAYVRVRAVGLGFRMSEPVWFRAVLWPAVAVGLLLGWAELALWGVALVSAVVLAVEVTELSGQREPG